MMKSVVTSAALAAVALGFVFAQGRGGGGPALDPSKFTTQTRDYDRKALLASQQRLSEEAHLGRIIWLQRCAYCHDGVGQPTYRTIGPWLGKESVDAMGAEGFRTFVEAGTGNMPGFQYTLTPQQMGQVMAYLNTVPSSTKPTPNQLAGRSSEAANQGE